MATVPGELEVDQGLGEGGQATASGRRRFKAKKAEIPGIRSDHPSDTGLPEDGRELSVEDSLAAELVLREPGEGQACGIVGRKDMPNLRYVPPETGFGDSRLERTRVLNASPVVVSCSVIMAFASTAARRLPPGAKMNCA